MSEPTRGRRGETVPVAPSAPTHPLVVEPAAPPESLLHEPPVAGVPTSDVPLSRYAPPPSAPPAPPSYRPVPAYESTALHSGFGVSQADRNWAVAAHLAGFVAAWVALGFLGPLIVLVTEGGRRPFARRHAVEALNFNLSVLLWCILSAVLMLVLIGFVMLAAVGVLYLVATVLGAMAASRGEDFRYPLTIRFVS